MKSTYHWFLPKKDDRSGAARELQIVRKTGDLVEFFGMTDSVPTSDISGTFSAPLQVPMARPLKKAVRGVAKQAPERPAARKIARAKKSAARTRGTGPRVRRVKMT